MKGDFQYSGFNENINSIFRRFIWLSDENVIKMIVFGKPYSSGLKIFFKNQIFSNVCEIIWAKWLHFSCLHFQDGELKSFRIFFLFHFYIDKWECFKHVTPFITECSNVCPYFNQYYFIFFTAEQVTYFGIKKCPIFA